MRYLAALSLLLVLSGCCRRESSHSDDSFESRRRYISQAVEQMENFDGVDCVDTWEYDVTYDTHIVLYVPDADKRDAAAKRMSELIPSRLSRNVTIDVLPYRKKCGRKLGADQ